MRNSGLSKLSAGALLRVVSTALVMLSSVAAAAPAYAGDKDKKDTSSDSKEKASAGSDKGSDRRDPNGQTGISPFTEKLVKGHKLMVAREFAGAIAAYKEAITEAPNNPLGHLYVGAAQQASGNLDEADIAWQNALRFVGSSDDIAAKVLFLQADLKERQKKLDEAKAAWDKYAKFVADHPNSKGFPGSTAERNKAIDAEVDITKKYAEVKKRIAKRIEELGKGPADAPDKPMKK
jgi:tetratricopeptide (TPR) repeat protein